MSNPKEPKYLQLISIPTIIASQNYCSCLGLLLKGLHFTVMKIDPAEVFLTDKKKKWITGPFTDIQREPI